MNRQGSILIGALMVIGFSLLVGVPLLQAANLEHQASINDQLDAQAFYLAEAGIEHAKAEVVKELLRMHYEEGWWPGDPVPEPFLTVQRDSFGPGNYQATVSLDPQSNSEDAHVYLARINSDGIVASMLGIAKTNTLDLPLVVREIVTGEGDVGPPGSGEPSGQPPAGEDERPSPLDLALFSSGKIEMTGSAKLRGPVVTNSTAKDAIMMGWSTNIEGDLLLGPGAITDVVINAQQGAHEQISGTIGNLDKERNYPLYQLPEPPNDLPGRGHFSGSSISEDGRYDSITVGAQLTIDVGDSQTIRRIRVGNLELRGDSSVVLQGDGRLELYIDHSIDSLAQGSIQLNAGGHPDRLYLFYYGDSRINISGNNRVRSFVYVSHAEAEVHTSNDNFWGVLISNGNNVAVTGNAKPTMLLYAPQASVTISGSSMVRGSVVCKDITMGGGNNYFIDWDQSVADLYSTLFSLDGGQLNIRINIDPDNIAAWASRR